MKGILKKTKIGWEIEYDDDNGYREEIYLPATPNLVRIKLHPDDSKDISNGYALTCWEGRKVDFEFCRSIPFARLIEEFEILKTWKDIIEEYHEERGHLSEDEMTNSDFCNFLTKNYNPPTKK